jgi:hypothetical protein
VRIYVFKSETRKRPLPNMTAGWLSSSPSRAGLDPRIHREKAILSDQCRVPCLWLCIRISILMHACAIENSQASAATSSEAVSNESTISSPQALFSGFISLHSLTWTV